jgi:hypothetical protein
MGTRARRINRAVTALLAALLLAGCASPPDWRYSEIAAAVDGFMKEQPPTGAKLPQKVRSIYLDGADTLRVYLSDDPGFRGHGYELKLKRSPSGTWVVVGSRVFG